jgi:hypothetical protein
MATVSRGLNKEGLTLRSGGARGADSAFEEGAGSQKEVFLPWQGFNSRYGGVKEKNGYRLASSQPGWKGALETVDTYHPSPEKLSPPGRLLMARNAMQILGGDLKTPSKFVVCWTLGGKETGGTSQALRIARDHNIPIFNLGSSTTLNEVVKCASDSCTLLEFFLRFS